MRALLPVAVRSVAYRLTSFVASAIAIASAALLVGCFATLAETGLRPGVPDASGEILVVMGIAISSWGAVLALTSLVSTLSLTVRRRAEELRGLHTLGATDRQRRALVQAEVLVVGTLAASLGAALAWPAGRWVFRLVQDAGMVAPTVGFAGGWRSLLPVALATLVISLVAARIAATRLGSPRSAAGARARRWRTAGGAVLVIAGLGAAAATFLVTGPDDDPYLIMATAGNAGLLVAAGFATVATRFVPYAARAADGILRRLGAAGDLAGRTTSERPHLLAPVLGAGMTFTAATTGVLMLTGIDRRTFVLPPDMSAEMAGTITVLNRVIVAMIAGFSLLVLITTLAAVMDDRRQEFALLSRLGATDRQVRQATAAETALIGAAAALLGSLSSLATVVPFAIARDEGLVPDGQLWLPVAVALATLAVTVLGGLTTAPRASRAAARRGRTVLRPARSVRLPGGASPLGRSGP